MVHTVEKPSNPGFAGGIAKRSAVQRLAWALKGAERLRKKDLRLGAMAAVAEGRKLRERVTDLMLRAGAEPEDARVYCVFVEKEAFAELPVGADAETIDSFLDAPRPVPKLARLRVNDEVQDIKLAGKFATAIPTGFLIFVWDRNEWARNDPRQSVVWTIRPLLVEDNRATGMNSYAMRLEKKRIEGQLANSSGVFPDVQD